jgi:hypothetical protein
MRRHVRVAQPRVTIKEKVVKQRLRCCNCGDRMLLGSTGKWVMTKPKWYHTDCVPADALEANSGVKKIALPETPEEAKMQAVLALENSLVVTAKMTGITDEMRKAFDRYNKCKAHYLTNKNDHEARAGFVAAVTAIVKVAF